MPNPLMYLAAMMAAATVAAVIILTIGWRRSSASDVWLPAASILGIAAGMLAGCCVLQLCPAIPPVNALDRFLVVVLPAALLVELAASFPGVSRGMIWWLRMTLAAAAGRILLHGSVYLSGVDSTWTLPQTLALLVTCAALMAGVWILLAWLAQRSASQVSISLSLALAIQSAGLAIMLAGYLKGGAAALPLAAALVAVCASLRWLTSSADLQSTVSVGVVGLSGLLFIGRFFVGLSTPAALVVFLAPLLCWATELPMLRKRPAWVVETLRLVLVAIPLIAVLVLAKQRFDRETAPLLVQFISTQDARDAPSMYFSTAASSGSTVSC